MYKVSISNVLRNSHTKNHFKNRLIFDRVIGKIKRGGRFLWTVVKVGMSPLPGGR